VVEVLDRVTMQIFVRRDCTMIAAPVQCDVDGVPKGSHFARVPPTLDLFAVLNVGSGEVLHDTRRSHTGHDVLAFLRWIDMHTDLDLRVILDNLSAHKSQPV